MYEGFIVKNRLQNNKRFLFPILSLVIISIIFVVSIITYYNIGIFKTHMQKDIYNKKANYLEEHKKLIYKNVQLINNAIDFQKNRLDTILKKNLQERIEIAYKIAQHTYDTYKNKLSKQEMRKLIVGYLDPITFNNDRGFYFISDYVDNKILGHKIKKFIGKDMTNFHDTHGNKLVELRNDAIKDGRIGFFKVYFNKPNDTKHEYPKLNAAVLFKPLNIVIGTGEYLDIVKKQLQKLILQRVDNLSKNSNNYMSILQLHNINGGDNFATVLLDNNNLTSINKNISDNLKDAKGIEYYKQCLKDLRKNQETYLEYWYKDINENKVKPKLEYFYWQKDWNWIISSGFYYDDLEIQTANIEKNVKSYTINTIKNSISWIVFFTILVILIAMYISYKIDNTINQYTNQLIEQEKLLLEQEKLASMGEMIGNIAHQWRQPLSAITMASTSVKLEKQLNILDEDQLIKTCDLINDNAQYLSRTIDDFRNFIKGDREKQIFNLKESIDSFLNLVAGTINKEHIQIVLNLEDDIQINGYKNELVQCFINIFNNAKDALVENINDDRLVFITTKKENNNVIIKIKDNAKGINENILSRIFEPYFTTKDQNQGTGLGLHMTYSLIVDGMNGSIDVKNVRYEYKYNYYTGAEFEIILPLSDKKV